MQGHALHGMLLRDLGLPGPTLALLHSHSLTSARDVLLLSTLDAMELLNLPHVQAEQLLQHVAMQTAPPYTTALQLHAASHEHSVRVLTGLPGLDSALRGGIPPGIVTELVGPAGVGKSQFCYELALQVALPRALGGLEATLMYIDTEAKFSSQRLLEMANARLLSAAASLAAPGGGSPPAWSYDALVEPVLTRVLVMRAASTDQLQGQLQGLRQEVARRDIKLVLLDSAAALLRTEFEAGAVAGLSARGELLGQQAAALKALAEAHRIPVVVTNQVTARPSGPATHAFQQPRAPGLAGSSSSSAGQLSAALGTKWAHAVNVRLVLERYGQRRFIKIAKSPMSAAAVVEYAISEGGVAEVMGGGEVPAAVQQSALEVHIANEAAPWD